MKAIEGNYINETFARMSLLQIRKFLLKGTEGTETITQSYHERLKGSSNSIFQRLDDMYLPDRTERDRAAADLSDALSTTEEVYMELGMKAGARIIYQLLRTDDLPRRPEAETEPEEA